MKAANRTSIRSDRDLLLPFEEIVADKIAREVSAKTGLPVKVIFNDNTTVMISFRRTKDRVLKLRLHRMFNEAGDDVIKELAAYVECRDQYASDVLSAYIKARRSAIRKTNPNRREKIVVNGKYHDLEKIYESLNHTQFEGKINAKITWGKKTVRKRRRNIRLGSYSYERKLIRIHPSLDQSWVPDYFVESVIYHEMLHAMLHPPKQNGRNRYHTTEFHRLEKMHPKYRKSQQWEKEHIKRLL